jgi:hypothetical protein
MKQTISPRKTILIFIMLLTLMSACSGGDAPTQNTGADPDLVETDEGEPQDPETIQLNWESGAHSDTFVVSDEGNNSTCARCHAPIIWVPAVEDMPESCSSCKFEVEQPPPYLAQEEWRPIECQVCHEADGDDVEPEIAWLEIAQIEEYEEVAGVDELCQKCHMANEITGHFSVTVGGDHIGYSCTDCHDAHSTVASCGGEGCHAEPSESVIGHDNAHAEVLCVACHDASNMQVGLDPDTSLWTTFIGSEGDEGLRPFTSHTTQASVDCGRCHYVDNPWGLSELGSSPNP